MGGDIVPTSGNRAYESFAIDGGLAPGSHTFAARYRVSAGGNATFEYRSLIVMPLP